MERDIEKTRRSGAVSAIASSTMDALAIVSIVFVFAAAVMAAAGASWRASAFMAIVGVLFDILFSYEFFLGALRRPSPFPWLAGLSSALPLLLVSGPFLAGWAGADLGSAAVRGYWLARSPLGGLSVVAALRLLRAARPFNVERQSGDDGAGRRVAALTHVDELRSIVARERAMLDPVVGGRAASSRAASSRAASSRAAAILGIGVVLAGAAMADALLIPGLSGSSAARRETAMDEIASAPDEGAMIRAARAGGAFALKDGERALLAAAGPVSPARYAVLSRGGLEAWFDVSYEARARGAAAAIAALASLAAAAGYAASLHGLWPRRLPAGRGTAAARPGATGAGEPGAPRRDAPAGSEELAGILGKRPR
ncbi:MAG: hypothetical protein H7A27_06655 [Spirochaetaceae bacterium]|nr:hypothetical protein [Spirochaetaceae bacterium]